MRAIVVLFLALGCAATKDESCSAAEEAETALVQMTLNVKNMAEEKADEGQPGFGFGFGGGNGVGQNKFMRSMQREAKRDMAGLKKAQAEEAKAEDEKIRVNQLAMMDPGMVDRGNPLYARVRQKWKRQAKKEGNYEEWKAEMVEDDKLYKEQIEKDDEERQAEDYEKALAANESDEYLTTLEKNDKAKDEADEKKAKLQAERKEYIDDGHSVSQWQEHRRQVRLKAETKRNKDMLMESRAKHIFSEEQTGVKLTKGDQKVLDKFTKLHPETVEEWKHASEEAEKKEAEKKEAEDTEDA